MKKVSISLAVIGAILALIGVIAQLNNCNGELLFFVAGAFILMAIVTLVCRKKTVVISAGVLVMYIAIICQYIMFNSFYIANMYIIMALVVGLLLILYGIIAGLKTKK